MSRKINLDSAYTSLGSRNDKAYVRGRRRIMKARGKARKSLIALLSSRDYLVRCRAAMILGQIGGAEVFPHLAKLLEDPQPEVRYDALISMGKLLDRRAIPILLSEFEKHDETNGLSSAAASSLIKFSGCAGF